MWDAGRGVGDQAGQVASDGTAEAGSVQHWPWGPADAAAQLSVLRAQDLLHRQRGSDREPQCVQPVQEAAYLPGSLLPAPPPPPPS